MSWRAGTLGALAALLAALSAATWLPDRADAGVFRALACEARAPGTPAAEYEASDARWVAHNYCATGNGLELLGAPGIPHGSSARWSVSAPPGLGFRRGWFRVGGIWDHEYHASYSYRLAGQAESTVVGEISQNGWADWPTADAPRILADRLVIELACRTSPSCSHGWAGFKAQEFGFIVEDLTQPRVTQVAGALTEGPAQRGTQLLDVGAADQGGGVRQFELRVNGQRFATAEAGCVTGGDGDGPFAVGLTPCPANATTTFAVDTTSAPFGEGQNAIEVCVTDYAQEEADPTSFAGQACTPLGVYVDNSCPVSQAPDAADLRFGFGKRGKPRMTVRYGKRAGAVAKLSDAASAPIEGATVCVSARDRIDGAGELDVAELQTNKRGKARVKLPKGASRQVKLTYWRDSENVEIKTVRLDVRARPKLKVLSKRKLSEGAKARFRVKLAGPYRKRRKVAVQALAPAGWLDFPGCVGKTNKRGVFRCSYRFREQSGSVKYKFRALAPRQSGYPYLQGHTGSEKLVVRD